MTLTFCPTTFQKNQPTTITVTSTTSLTGFTLEAVKYRKKNRIRWRQWPTSSFAIGNPSTTATIYVTSAKDDEEKGAPEELDLPTDPPTTGDLTVDLWDPNGYEEPIIQPIDLVP